MVFCNLTCREIFKRYGRVTILILIDGFLQFKHTDKVLANCSIVTILILIDGFLQFSSWLHIKFDEDSHNPYFNRWFSAIYGSFIDEKNIQKSQSLF